jgi:hypothetical protein
MGQRLRQGRNQYEAGRKQRLICYLLHIGFLLGSFFDAEDGHSMFHPEIGQFSVNYTVLYPRRQNSS